MCILREILAFPFCNLKYYVIWQLDLLMKYATYIEIELKLYLSIGKIAEFSQ